MKTLFKAVINKETFHVKSSTSRGAYNLIRRRALALGMFPDVKDFSRQLEDKSWSKIRYNLVKSLKKNFYTFFEI